MGYICTAVMARLAFCTQTRPSIAHECFDRPTGPLLKLRAAAKACVERAVFFRRACRVRFRLLVLLL